MSNFFWMPRKANMFVLSNLQTNNSTLIMKTQWTYVFVALLLFQYSVTAQSKKSVVTKDITTTKDIIMTWNKDTPESEMKDDIQALANQGVTIAYSNLKRNNAGEITSITVTYADETGSKGSMTMENKNPIHSLQFFKQDDAIGFGPPQGGLGNDNPLISGNEDVQTLIRKYNLHGNGLADDMGKPGNPGMPESRSFSQMNSKIIIQQNGKKPLVMEDGKIVEGGDDYTPEELNAIKENNRIEMHSGTADDMMSPFQSNSNDFGNLAEQMKKMQEQMNEMMSKNGLNPDPLQVPKNDMDSTKKEMEQAKKELQEAKKEMQEAKKELEKAKSSLKSQKA